MFNYSNSLFFTKTYLILTLSFLFSCSDDINVNQIDLKNNFLISDNGSARATAYYSSNKIIETKNSLYFTFLENIQDKEIVKIRKISKNNFKDVEEFQIGEVDDDHGGATILIDSKNHIHLFYGSHSESLNYVRSIYPDDISKWSEVTRIDNALNYPSAVINKNDEILLLVRKITGNVFSEKKWEYVLYTIKNSTIVNSKIIFLGNQFSEDVHSRYINYYAQFSITNRGRIYLSFIPHERPLDDPHVLEDGLGYGISLIYSDDFGNSWYDYTNKKKLTLPLNPNEYSFIEGTKLSKNASKNYRGLSMAVNPIDNLPIISYTLFDFVNDKWECWLLNHSNSNIQKKLLSNKVVQSSIFVNYQFIYVVLETIESNLSPITSWGHNSMKLELLQSKNYPIKFDRSVIAENNNFEPKWLTQFPKKNSEYHEPITPYLLFTEGNIKPTGNKIYLIKNISNK